MHQRCVEQQTPPDVKPGDYVFHGKFFRNLKKGHVAKRYELDDDEQPKYGSKLKTEHWKDADAQRGGLSVNLQPCMHSEACSIALQKNSERYFHVAIIDLEVLNHLLDSTLVAQYKPVERNSCHFEIAPFESWDLSLMAIGELMDRPFPTGRIPRTDQDEAQAENQYQIYRSYCDIRRWVRDKLTRQLRWPTDLPTSGIEKNST